MTIKEKLFILKDDEYKKFQSKLMPTVNSNMIIGVRVPVLRQLAKEIFKSGEYVGFLNALPHKYYDENNLHAFIIEQIPDFNTALLETEKFLPYIDNWATCDMFMPRCFKNNLDEISKNIFSALRKVDSFNPNIVFIEGVESTGLGLAIMNRLIRACEYNYIEV